jgi:hypothetical protein
VKSEDVGYPPVSYRTIPEDRDWLKIYVRISADSAQVSFRIRGEISSGPRDILQFKPDNNLMTPFLPPCCSGMLEYGHGRGLS